MINAVIFVVFAACGAMFVFGTRRTRALLALLSIFIANLEFEVGIGLNLPVLLTILATFLLMTGQISIHPRAAALFSSRMFLFLFWAFGVWLVGFLCLDVVNDAQFGWTRSSTVKPIVQLIRFVLFVPFGLAVADGIRSKADVHWFLKNWTRIAVISALGCMVQVGAHKLTGQSLGTYRIHQGEFHMTFAKFAGTRVLRANGLAGEPKSQGMAMAMSLCMLFGTLGRGLIPLSRQRHILCIGLVGIALLLTFSSGAIAMTAVLIGLVMLGQQSRSAKRIAVAVVLFIAAVTLQFSVTASSMWESRLERIVSITTDVRGQGWGMDKERPAMIYLLEHPHLAMTGVGIGMGPYHFDHLIAERAFRGKYVDPNSGLLWGLYGFGVIGWGLLLAALKPELFGGGMSAAFAPSLTLFMRFTLLYFLVYTPLWWLMIGIGIACARECSGERLPGPSKRRRIKARLILLKGKWHMQPKITVVTPSYNQAEYLEATIQSVLAQRDQIHEYFVLDGGSTDGSREIIKKYAGGIDYWISAKDAGQADAIRQGFRRATGDVLAWLNSDDLLLPGAIAAVSQRFERFPDTEAVTGHYCQIDAQGRLLRCMWIPQMRQGWIRWGVTRICQPSTFFRRELYEAVGGLDPRWRCVLDTELWCRMLRRQCHWHVLPQYVAARRYHPQTKGSTLTDQYRRERHELARLYPEYRPGPLKRTIGRWTFRSYQCCNPQFWRSNLDTLLHRHKPLSTSLSRA